MRWIVLILIVLALGAAWTCSIESGNPHSWDSIRWVRTRDGWEDARTLSPPPAVYDSDLHPFVFASGLLLVSLLLLVAFSGGRRADG